MRKGGEPKYAHLSMELHVFIEVFAPVPDAYLRMAHAMEEVKKFLFPVSVPPCWSATLTHSVQLSHGPMGSKWYVAPGVQTGQTHTQKPLLVFQTNNCQELEATGLVTGRCVTKCIFP